jgi:acylphosphatase
VIARRVVISGHVQGVFFRQGTLDAARRAGVAGWVRNAPDGTVEAHLEGEPDAVERVLSFCRRGPRGARVDHVEVRDVEPEGLDAFAVR